MFDWLHPDDHVKCLTCGFYLGIARALERHRGHTLRVPRDTRAAETARATAKAELDARYQPRASAFQDNGINMIDAETDAKIAALEAPYYAAQRAALEAVDAKYRPLIAQAWGNAPDSFSVADPDALDRIDEAHEAERRATIARLRREFENNILEIRRLRYESNVQYTIEVQRLPSVRHETFEYLVP